MNTVIFRTALALALPIGMLVAASPPSGAVVSVDFPGACSDRNALRDIAVDARLNAIKFYYKGFIQNVGDRDKQKCLAARVLQDDRFAVINTTLDLIDSQCLPVEVAAQMATEGLCR